MSDFEIEIKATDKDGRTPAGTSSMSRRPPPRRSRQPKASSRSCGTPGLPVAVRFGPSRATGDHAVAGGVTLPGFGSPIFSMADFQWIAWALLIGGLLLAGIWAVRARR
jgi:hypothetical protein